MKFEQDFNELIKLNEKINKLRKDIVDLEAELGVNCKDFVKKHGINISMNKLESIENLLNRGVSPKQLMDLIQRVDKEGVGIFGLLLSIKNHIEGKKLDNELFNFNKDVIEKLELNYKSLDSIENIQSLNNLEVSSDSFEYLIDMKTEKLLKSADDPKFKRINDENQFVYMVVFNTLKIGDDWVVIYNYIAYNKILFNLLYVYAALVQKKFGLYQGGHIAADFLFVIDKQLSENLYISNIDNIINNNDTLLTSGGLNEALSINYWYNFIQIAKCCVNGNIKGMNYEEMGELIKFLRLKDEINILKILYKDLEIEKWQDYVNSAEWYNIYNYLSRFIFIVSDLPSFVNSIEKSIGCRLNQGPQRGNICYISYILTCIDKAFRDSMYNHNRMYVEKLYNKDYEYKHERYIHKSSFSYKNIHINLGKVRWYSISSGGFKASSPIKLSNNNTIIGGSSSQLSYLHRCNVFSQRLLSTKKNNIQLDGILKDDSVYLENISINKNYKDIDVMFSDIKSFLSKNNINKDTQLKLEKFLNDVEVDRELNIYARIGKINPHLKIILEDSAKDLDNLINNFKSRKLFECNVDEMKSNELSFYYLSHILKIVPNDYIIQIKIGLFLCVLNNHRAEDNYCVKLQGELGKKLINYYFYLLRKMLIDSDKNKYKDYTLSDWKYDNKDIVEIYKVELVHSIGSNLIEWLKELDLLDLQLVKSLEDSKHSICVYKINNRLEKYVNKSESIPLNKLTKLPMIVKPKPYKRVVLKDGELNKF